MFGVFPRELYIAIVEQIPQEDTSTLYQLLLTSKLFYDEGSRRLYENLGLESGYPGGKEKENAEARRQLSLYITLRQNADLARLVRKFYANTRVTFIGPGISYWQTFTAALQVLTNLKSLQFFPDHWDRPVDGRSSLLEGCTFDLHELEWSGHYERSFVTFLESQPHIQHVNLNWYDLPMLGVTPLPPSTLPNLRVLSGNTTVIYKLLPGRAITHLRLSPNPWEGEDPDMTYIGPALSSVRVLKFGSHDCNLAFSPLARYLVNLEIFHWELAEDSLGYIETLISNLNALKRLYKLVLWMIEPIADTSSCVKRIFQASPSMREVVADGPDGALLSWTRVDEGESFDVAWKEVMMDDAVWDEIF